MLLISWLIIAPACKKDKMTDSSTESQLENMGDGRLEADVVIERFADQGVA